MLCVILSCAGSHCVAGTLPILLPHYRHQAMYSVQYWLALMANQSHDVWRANTTRPRHRDRQPEGDTPNDRFVLGLVLFVSY